MLRMVGGAQHRSLSDVYKFVMGSVILVYDNGFQVMTDISRNVNMGYVNQTLTDSLFCYNGSLNLNTHNYIQLKIN